MFRVLVTGASGFIGQRVVRRLVADGHHVVAVSRSPVAQLPPGALSAVIPEISGETSWSHLLAGTNLVIHCAAHISSSGNRALRSEEHFQRVNVDGTKVLAAQAAEAGVRRFIFLSSIKVHGESTEANTHFHEMSPVAPVDSYGRSKAAAESAILAVSSSTAMESVILRPPVVYGEGVRGNFALLLRLIQLGLPIPLGAVEGNRRSFIGAHNLVDCIRYCADHPDAAQQVFVVSDGQDLSTVALIRLLATAMGRQACLVNVSPAILRTVAAVTGRSALALRLLDSLCVDSSRIRAVTGWCPPMSVGEGFRRMAVLK